MSESHASVAAPSERCVELERLVRAVLPELLAVRWQRDGGPFLSCRISVSFEARFELHEHTPDAVVLELVDVARCHLLRTVANAVAEGKL